MEAFVCAGFLLAVVWFDLMFDVQALRHRDGDVPEAVLASIASYYRRVTTEARPMNFLVAFAMLGTIAAIVVEVARDVDPAWVGWVSLALIAPPVVLARVRTVPSAVRLGTRRDPLPRQAELARMVGRDHVVCIISLAVLLGVQLSSAV